MNFTDREIDRLLLVLASVAVLTVFAMVTHGRVAWTAISLACLAASGATLFMVLRSTRTGGAS